MMTITVLMCRADGTQALEQREVPECWFQENAEQAEE